MVGDHCCNSPVAGKHIIGQLRAPPNTVAAGPASASSSSSSSLACGASKRQRRSVAEAAQVAQVRQKVALFESFKGATVAALPTSSAVGAGPSAAGVSNGGGGSPSSPARPVGEAPAAASGAAAGRGSGGSSSSGSVGSSTYHAVFPGLDLSLTSMPSRAALFAPPQPQPQQQPPPRASEEKVDAVVAPVEASRDDGAAAPGAPAQQIMAAMRELRIAETEGAMELVVHEEGPEPIIECNHKQPGAAPVWLSSSSKLSGEQPPPSSSQQQQQESGGFFGMVQKTLGLGKHRTSSTGGATQQQQQQPLPAPAAVSPPLSPLRPENTYQMSDR